MKRIVFFLFFACVVTVFVCAENYTVQSVTGRVQRESGSAKVDVKAGDTLDGEIIISTGVGASIVLKDGANKSITVPAAKNGKVTELVKSASGVRVGGNVTRTDTSTVNRSTAQVSTASARASDAAGDNDIAAE